MTDSKDTKKGGLFSALREGMEKVQASLSDPSGLPHTIRQQAAQYNPHQNADTLKLQLAIKSASGVVIDEQALARETAMYSKNLFLWGKDDKGADLVDLTDRLAFLVYQSGEITKLHAERLNQSRQSLKDIRNFENELVPRRKQRETIAAKLASNKNANDAARLKSELEELEKDNSTFESSLEALKRTKLHEAFALHFSAQRELGEKQAIIAGYGELLLRGFETDGFGADYKGHERTARVKGELGEALEAWSPTKPLVAAPELKEGGSSYLGRSDTQSFGSTHANELSQLDDTSAPNPLAHMPTATLTSPAHARVLAPIPDVATPTGEQPRYHLSDPSPSSATASRPVPLAPSHHPSSSSSISSTIGVAGSPSHNLNLSPTPKDLGPSYSPSTSPLPAEPLEPTELGIPTGPTVAETGAPIVGTGGPASGQLPVRPHAASHAHNSNEAPIPLASFGGSFPSAEEEKRRLEQAQVEQARASHESLSRATSTSRHSLDGSAEAGGGVPISTEDLPAYMDGIGEEEEPSARAEREAAEILAAERERKGASLV